MKMEGKGGGVRPASLTRWLLGLRGEMEGGRRTMLHVVESDTTDDGDLFDGEGAEEGLNVDNLIGDLGVVGVDVVAGDDLGLEGTGLCELSNVVLVGDDGLSVVDLSVGGLEANQASPVNHVERCGEASWEDCFGCLATEKAKG